MSTSFAGSGPEFLWTLPTRGDGRRGPLGDRPRGDWDLTTGARRPDWITDLRGTDLTPFDHLSQIAIAAEHALFSGVLAPYDPQGEESWIVTSALARETRWTSLIPELALGSTTAVYAAKMSATFQRVTGGRIGWRLTPGTDLLAGRRAGAEPVNDEWFERAGEFLTVARGVWHERGFTFDGRWYQVENGGFPPPLADLPFPRVYTSGEQPEALQFAGQHGDVHLLTYAGDNELAVALADLQWQAQRADREVRAGLVLPIIAREDEYEAWDRLRRLWAVHGLETTAGVDDDVASRREGDVVWNGFDALGWGPARGLVGSYDGVAQALRSLTAQGVGTFLLSGYPQIEEVYRLGEHLLHRVHSPSIPAAIAAV